MVTGIVGILDAFVKMTAAVQLLVLLDERCEGDFCEATAHGISLWR
jgi:hypothetical protein